MTDTVGWAVVGSSEFALDFVLPAIQAVPDCAVCAIVSRHPERLTARLAGQKASDIAVTSRLADLPGLGADVVHLVIPNDLHSPMTLECLSLGLPVLVEKPMALTATQGAAMAAAAQAAGRLLAVGSSMAWSPTIIRTAALLADGTIGRAQHAAISAGFDTGEQRGWRQLTPVAGGGGVLYDLGAHAIDAMIRLFGDVAEVAASLRTTLPRHESDDTASLMLRHHGGVTSHLELAFTHGCNQLSVTGTAGELSSWEWLGRRFAGNLVRHTEQADAARLRSGPGGSIDEMPGASVTDVLALQVAEVAAAVRDGTAAPHADLGTALQVMRVIDAAITSSATRRSITLPQ